MWWAKWVQLVNLHSCGCWWLHKLCVRPGGSVIQRASQQQNLLKNCVKTKKISIWSTLWDVLEKQLYASPTSQLKLRSTAIWRRHDTSNECFHQLQQIVLFDSQSTNDWYSPLQKHRRSEVWSLHGSASKPAFFLVASRGRLQKKKRLRQKKSEKWPFVWLT